MHLLGQVVTTTTTRGPRSYSRDGQCSQNRYLSATSGGSDAVVARDGNHCVEGPECLGVIIGIELEPQSADSADGRDHSSAVGCVGAAELNNQLDGGLCSKGRDRLRLPDRLGGLGPNLFPGLLA